MSFLFRIDQIAPDFGQQPIQFYSNRDWQPPTWAVGLRTVQTGRLYRWQAGVVFPVAQHDQAFIRITQSPKQYQQSAGTVFSHSPYSQSFYAVDFDARWENIDPDYQWEKLTFTHTQHPHDPRFYYSELGICRDSYQMATPTVAPWQSDLFPPQMRCDVNNVSASNRFNAGLIGDLSFLLAVIAFSGPSQQLPGILQNCLNRSANPTSSLGSWQQLPGASTHGSMS